MARAVICDAAGVTGVYASSPPRTEPSVTCSPRSSMRAEPSFLSLCRRSSRNRNSSSLLYVLVDRNCFRGVAFNAQLKPCVWSQNVSLCTSDTKGASSSGPNVSVSCSSLVNDQTDGSDDIITVQSQELISSGGGLSFFTRLALAWNILFPSKCNKPSSNADIAKQRLKMILFSDRCSVTDEARRRIVDNIVGALAEFVEIESEDKVQLTVSSDPSLGTVYSVTVPVRRVKPEYQEYSRELQNVALAEEFADEFRTLDIKFEYPCPLDAQQDL